MYDERCDFMKKEMLRKALDGLDEKYIIEAEELVDDSPNNILPEKDNSKTGNIAFVLCAMAAALVCVIGVGAVFKNRDKGVEVTPAATAEATVTHESLPLATTYTQITEVTEVSGVEPLITTSTYVSREEDVTEISVHAPSDDIIHTTTVTAVTGEIGIEDGEMYLADYCYANNADIEEITLPEGTTELGEGVFLNCINLKTITLPNSLKKIGKDAFKGCTSLKEVNLGFNLTEIGESAFENCISLERISTDDGFTISYGLEIIGDYAFKNCESLWLVLPDSIKTIGEGAFTGCELLDGSCKPVADTTVDLNYNGEDIGERFLLEAYPCDNFYSITTQCGPVPFYGKIHAGIDISWEGCHGANIYAAKSGVVKESVKEYEENKGYGKYVVISHEGGYETVYYHCNDVYVEEGDKVQTGDIIASIGTTGWSTGPHLHFGLLRDDGAVLNPLEHYNERFAILDAVKSEYSGGDIKLNAPVEYPEAITELFGLDGGYIGHTGIDYAWENCLGADVYAAADGTVTYSDWLSDYGLCVIIDHGNGIGTLYSNCGETIAEEGDTVKTGDKIATIGSTGIVTGTCLHFEVVINGYPNNPLRFLSE